MKQQVENINKYNQHINRKQIVNFKQLLKLKSMKRARKIDHENSLKVKNILKESICNKSFQNRSYQNSHFKLPFQDKSFQEINLRQLNHQTYGKCCREVVFPLLKLQYQHSPGQYSNDRINKSNNLSSRVDFFQKNREVNIEKLKQAISNRNKRKFRYFKSRQSQLSLPSKLDCRSISPLTNYGESFQKRYSIAEQTQYKGSKCRVSSSMQKVSARYQDISISQFMYDQYESSQPPQKNIQIKMQRIWRKKSKNAKEITSHT